MTPTVAFIAEGKLYLKRPDAAPQLLESPFVDELHDRAARARDRNEWKQASTGWNFTANRFGVAAPVSTEVRRVRYGGVTRTADGLIYALDTDTVGGLFEYTPADGYERRLYHRQQFHATDVHRHPAIGRLLMSLAGDAGTWHLAVAQPDGRKLQAITEGDAIDLAPAWVDGAENLIVYQSAGIGRSASGIFAGQSPFALHRLDTATGEGGTFLEQAGHDLLAPRQLADGSVYFIRRPYRGPPKPTVWQYAKDAVLFPFRVVLAVVHFLNFFSLMFRQKPLLTGGGPPGTGPDPKFLLLYGRIIAADRLLKQNTAAPLVPKDWQLVRRSADGAESIVATGVGAYDLTPDGRVVYTDGTSLFAVNADGGTASIGGGTLIERVVVV